MGSNVIHVDFRPSPEVSRAVFDSSTGEWTLTVARQPLGITPAPADVPIDVRDALVRWVGPHDKIGPVSA